jgi:hypothetical protein
VVPGAVFRETKCSKLLDMERNMSQYAYSESRRYLMPVDDDETRSRCEHRSKCSCLSPKRTP